MVSYFTFEMVFSSRYAFQACGLQFNMFAARFVGTARQSRGLHGAYARCARAPAALKRGGPFPSVKSWRQAEVLGKPLGLKC